MKAVLFCANPYAFGILEPLWRELKKRQYEILWYLPFRMAHLFPFKEEVGYTSEIQTLYFFKSDMIFVPGNEVPHYLHGVKVQVFHGLAGEKRGHFKIRNYFDLYLTQGPYFTKGFKKITQGRTDIEVIETGWCKLDNLFSNHEQYLQEKSKLLQSHKRAKVVLYAPTFSPRLTSAKTALDDVFAVADSPEILLLVKFHDLMDKEVANQYEMEAKKRDNVIIVEDRNIIKTMIMSDLMISDTSSVVYEFLLLNKPVVTINSTSKNISWLDIEHASLLKNAVTTELNQNHFKELRAKIIAEYHPYMDGLSSARMVDAVEDFISRNGVPERRSLNWHRRLKVKALFGPEPKNLGPRN